MTDQLLAVLVLDRDHGLEELHQGLAFALGGEEEVKTLMVRFDADTVLGGVVFNQQLFQKEQSLSLFSFLPHLEEKLVINKTHKIKLNHT